MGFTYRIWFAMVLLLWAGIKVEAQEAPLPVNCAPAPPCVPSRSQVCIDAETRTVYTKTTSVDKGSVVSVTVYNKNPFAYTYKLNVDEKVVTDDDISSFLKLILPSAAKSDVQPQKAAAQAGSDKVASLFEAYTSKVMLAEHAAAKTPAQEMEDLKQEVSDLADAISSQFDAYASFVPRYDSWTGKLNGAKCSEVGSLANSLRNDAVETRASLLIGLSTTEANINLIRVNYDHLDADVTKAVAEGEQKLNADLATTPSKGDETKLQDTVRKDFEATKENQTLRSALDKTKASTLKLECMYLKYAQTQLAGLYSGVINPLEKAILRRDSFWRTESVGPYEDPNVVTVVLQQSEASAAKPLGEVRFQPDDATTCSKELLTANDFAGVAYGLNSDGTADSKGTGQKPKASAAAPSQDTSKNPKGTEKTTDDQFSQNSKVVLHFGGARFITAAGLTFGFLQNNQYARVSGLPLDQNGVPTSQTFTSIVGIKNDSTVRVVPSFFLHARILPAHNNEAWYASFGVGATSDNQGANAAYLIGASRSLLDQHFFITAGAFIGQQQTLKNGLRLGQDVSSLQGDLPIAQRTKAAFGLAISYRFNIGSSGSSATSKTANKSN